MKKFNQFLLFVLCMASTQIHASDIYLSVSDGDTLRISPNSLVWYAAVPVVAEFGNGVADHWRLEIIYPLSMSWDKFHYPYSENGPVYGMNIPYVKSDGTSEIYNAVLNVVQGEQQFSATSNRQIVESSTTVYGYWDYNSDGQYEPYGLVKWGPGHYNSMFDFRFEINGDCTGDSIIIDGLITSTYDSRYPTSVIYTHQFHRVVHLVMAYLLGDVDGDESVDMDDVTALTDYILGHSSLNQYQFDAADLDRNGIVNIDGVSALIDRLLNA